MANFSFENRVSLSRKSEDLTKTIEALSSDYNNRDDFMRKHPCTSEISVRLCIPPVLCVVTFIAALGWIAVVVAAAGIHIGVGVSVGAYVGCVYEVADDFSCFASIDQVSYKNIV